MHSPQDDADQGWQQWHEQVGREQEWDNDDYSTKAGRIAAKARIRALKPDDVGFKLVYQGGHHDVWCNGVEHRSCSGGHAGKWDKVTYSQYRCNCEFYARAAALDSGKSNQE